MKRYIILIIIVLSLSSCTVKHHAVMKFNHVTGAVMLNDTLAHPQQFDIWNQLDDEFEIVMFDGKITELKPVFFDYPFENYYRVGRVYFYSPDMSKYMQDHEWFLFEVTYTKSR